MSGCVEILNVGEGDVKITFDKDDPADRIRASRIVKDMISRGYALLVEFEPGKWTRAWDFDEEKCEYIIADFDASLAPESQSLSPPKRGGSRRSATNTNAVAVSKTAGG